jgi:A/G-specific adenine glycosylase
MPVSISKPLLAWYDQHQRILPWRAPRAGRPDAYRVLVSEVMLQQTQVATVIPYFDRFLKAFPTIKRLAAAEEAQVLRLWQGLGYYSRARNLRAAAVKIVADHGGQIPDDAAILLSLPGIGRYTAGAIASIAFDRREPILDGNVARVLCRLERIEADPRSPPTNRILWQLATNILPVKRTGDFNSAMMELGATVCTPRNPKCAICPLRRICSACKAGMQERIPPPKVARASPLEKRWTFAVRAANSGRWLIEQRPANGRWASMWQFATVPARSRKPDDSAATQALGLNVENVRTLGRIAHVLTHRRYVFTVFTCIAPNACSSVLRPRKWASLKSLAQYPMSNPQLKIAHMLKQMLKEMPF